MEIKDLQPQSLWKNFADLNAVPRASKKEEEVIAFAKAFGENLGLETKVDAVGNVIIKKPATAGLEGRCTVALQSHLDMVHQKNADTNFDFATQGIDMYIDGDWVKAKGTTLGADNGIGVAAIMALLESTDIPHPPLEALFTIDEETGMTGAMGLVGGLLDADILLNLDTEDDDELTVGCAGGVDVTAKGTYEVEALPTGYTTYKLTVKGLMGGHSGMDIHIGRGNANKLITRVLYELAKTLEVRLAAFDGGSLRNAIPREAQATIAVSTEQVAVFQAAVEGWRTTLTKEHKRTDPNFELLLEEVANAATVTSVVFQQKLVASLYAAPNGIYRMSADMDDLVQTSNNLARVSLKEGQYEILCLTRSAVDSEKQDHANMLRIVFEMMGAEVSLGGAYPGWTPNLEAKIITVMQDIYRDLFKEEPNVYAGHGGLECGLLGKHYPDMEMISFGPNIRGAHSPDERVQISSVKKFWHYLLTTLERIPASI
ncbi:MAG: aminoacyl-histidine dipeptidase [Aureispira sp.]